MLLQLWHGVFSAGDLAADLAGALLGASLILAVRAYDSRQQRLWAEKEAAIADIEQPSKEPSNPAAVRRFIRGSLLKY